MKAFARHSPLRFFRVLGVASGLVAAAASAQAPADVRSATRELLERQRGS